VGSTAEYKALTHLSSRSEPAPEVAEDAGGRAFGLINQLAQQLDQGELYLPALPDVVTLIRQALEREDVSIQELANLIHSEAALAGTILRLANSVMYRQGSSETTNIVTCINRLGTRMVRSISIHFAMRQLREAPQFRGIHHLLEPEWERSRVVSELSYSLARKTRRGHPDDMVTLGLVHNIGRIYILSQTADNADTFTEDGAARLMDQWHPLVGSTIAESWGLPPLAVEAIAQQSWPDDPYAEGADMKDLLVVAVAIEAADCHESQEQRLSALPAARRLGISTDVLDAVLEDAQAFGEVLALAGKFIRCG